MSLDTAWQVEQTWGSNQPALKGVVNGVTPRRALECGCGNYSTPLLRNGCESLCTVEHDATWMHEVQKNMPETATHEYRHLHLPGVKNGTARSDVSPDVLISIDTFYRHIVAGDGFWNFILIDTFRSVRVLAAAILLDHTDLLMLHDVEPKSRDFYGYHALDADLAGWHRYEHRPLGFINSVHQIPWTALYSREPLDLDAMQPHVIADSERLWGLSVGLEEIRG
jgi:hypothetical protein